MNFDGTDRRQLTNDGGDNGFVDLGPAWSPDGDRISFLGGFTGQCPCVGSLTVMDADGGNRQALATTRTAGLWSPDGSLLATGGGAWSPEGDRIAVSEYNPPAQIWSVPAAGGPVSPLLTGPEWEDGPVWSPDATQLAFRQTQDASFRLAFLDVTTGQVRVLSD